MQGRFVRNSLLSTIAALATALSGFISMVIVARSLGTAGTGTVAYAIWVVSMLVTIADFGIYQTLTRYLPEVSASQSIVAARRIAAVLVRPAPLLLLAGLAFCAWRTVGQGTDLLSEHDLWPLAGALFACQLLTNFGMGVLRGMQRFDEAAKLTVASLGLQLVAVLIGSTYDGIRGALLGYCAGSILPIFALLPFVLSRASAERNTLRRARRFAWFGWAGAVTLALVWSRLEIFFIERTLGTDAVALFSVGFTFATLAAQGPLLLTGALLAHFSERVGLGRKQDLESAYTTATCVMAFLLLPSCFGLAAILPAVVPLVYGQEFAAAVPVATILVAGSAVGAVGSVGSQVIYAYDRSDFIFASGSIGAILSVVAGLLIVPRFGITGAAVARIAIHALMFAMGSWYILRRLQLALPVGQLLKLTLAAAASAITAHAIVLTTAPPLLAIVLAITSSVCVYVLTVRLLGALAPVDITRLLEIACRLPRPAREPVVGIVTLLDARKT